MSESPAARERRSGALFVLLASLLFATGGLLIKWIPWSALAINGARDLIGAAVIGVFLLLTRHRPVFSGRVAVGAVSTMGVTTLFTVANKLTTAANAIVLQYTAPVFVIAFLALFYHERPKRRDLIACAAVLGGVCLFFVDGLRAGRWSGDLAALLSGVCYAGVFLMNTGAGADALSSCFWGQLAAGVLLGPLCLRETDFSTPTLAAVAALGVLQVGLAYCLLSLGIRRTPPVTASLITGLEPILNPLLVAVFYGERVTALSAAGAVIVVGSILIYQLRRAREAPGPNEEAEHEENPL